MEHHNESTNRTSEQAPRSRAPSIVRSARESLKADFAVGVLLLLAVVCLWTGSNFITQHIYENGYSKPFLVTYLNTASFALYFIPVGIRQAMHKFKVKVDPMEWESSRGRSGYEGQPLLQPSQTQSPVVLSSALSSGLPPLTTNETATLAFFFCILWFIANLTVNASLGFTSVASATIFSSMSGFFTLAIGRIFQVETLNLGKLMAVMISFTGCVLVSLSDSQNSGSIRDNLQSSLFGDFLALLSALFYALYVILLKVRIHDESRVNMQLFFGFVGLFDILTLWPFGAILHLTGVEPFELPKSRSAVLSILLNMAITWSSDYIYVFAMLKTTPLVVTIGISLTIPMAVLGDFLLLNRLASLQVVLGALLVLGSFVVVGLQSADEAETT